MNLAAPQPPPVKIEVGRAPVGLALGPDGRWLYATSEVAARPGNTCPNPSGGGLIPPGTVSTVDLGHSNETPTLTSTVDVGCSPVRIIVSADGRTAYVSLRAEGAVAKFATADLRAGQKRRLASFPVDSRRSASPYRWMVGRCSLLTQTGFREVAPAPCPVYDPTRDRNYGGPLPACSRAKSELYRTKSRLW